MATIGETYSPEYLKLLQAVFDYFEDETNQISYMNIDRALSKFETDITVDVLIEKMTPAHKKARAAKLNWTHYVNKLNWKLLEVLDVQDA